MRNIVVTIIVSIVLIGILILILALTGVFDSGDSKYKCISDIPDDVVDSYYSNYDRPSHTSGMYSGSGFLKL